MSLGNKACRRGISSFSLFIGSSWMKDDRHATDEDRAGRDDSGVSYARIPHGRGGSGAGKCPAFVQFERGNFLRLL